MVLPRGPGHELAGFGFFYPFGGSLVGFDLWHRSRSEIIRELMMSEGKREFAICIFAYAVFASVFASIYSALR